MSSTQVCVEECKKVSTTENDTISIIRQNTESLDFNNAGIFFEDFINDDDSCAGDEIPDTQADGNYSSITIVAGENGKHVDGFISKLRNALAMNISPVHADTESTGNVYYLCDQDKSYAAVFKPSDEEPGTPRHRDKYSMPLRNGIPAGEGFIREAAAYLLDRGGSAGVPFTTIVDITCRGWLQRSTLSCSPSSTRSSSCFSSSTLDSGSISSGSPRSSDLLGAAVEVQIPEKKSSFYSKLTKIEIPCIESVERSLNRDCSPVLKTGSIQKYIPHHSTAEDVGPGLFTVDMIHRIGIFDIRILNMDRHGGNLLIQTVIDRQEESLNSSRLPRRSISFCESTQREDFLKSIKIVPIDHGLCIPRIDSVANASIDQDEETITLEWMNWSQAKQPFSQEMIDFVNKLDVESDIRMLQTKLRGYMGPAEFITLSVCSLLLKHMVNAGYTLFDIGSVIVSHSLHQMVMRACIPRNLYDTPAVNKFLAQFANILNREYPKATPKA